MTPFNTQAGAFHQMLGVSHVPGMGFVAGGLAGVQSSQALSGEADVMMISGLGAGTDGPAQGVSAPPIPQPTLMGQLQQPVTIGTITLPLYGWLLLAALLGGAGGYYFGRR